MSLAGTDRIGPLIDELVALLGADRVLRGEEDRRFFSQDIYSAGATTACVAQPGTVEEVARCVALATAASYAVIPRGGGASYTGGYLSQEEQSIVVDTRRLGRIVKVSAEDMYVTVESGCTWKSLAAVLAEHGLRTPFWGPMSGAFATVGGSLSQNAILWGSASWGTSAESVLSLDVVLADGTLLRTGSAATRGAAPFFRHYGPDLTGLFLGDTGALGIKVRATLRLIRPPPELRYASFAFSTRGALLSAMTELARAGLAADCFGMDPTLANQRLKRDSLAKDLRALQGVVAAAPGLGEGVVEAARVVIAGRSFLDSSDYSLHLTLEDRTSFGVEERLDAARAIARAANGREVENTVPKVLRSDPFVSMTSAIGPRGERWAPVHGVVPLSQAEAAWSQILEILEKRRPELEQRHIVIGFLVAIISTHAFVLEPVFYWPGPRTLYYERVLAPQDLARFDAFARDPATERLVDELRHEITRKFLELGAAHLQIGKTYRYREGRETAAWKLLEAIKNAVDPGRLINPGSLGLD
jgi:FAD/FMN-containing dehydrogenase